MGAFGSGVRAFGAALVLAACGGSIAMETNDAGTDDSTATGGAPAIGGAAGADAKPDIGGADGAGSCASPTDCPGTALDCQYPTCAKGICGVQNFPAGTACVVDAKAHVCDGAGECVQCVNSTDCPEAGICVDHACVPASCFDGTKNGMETDADCGGNCQPCINGRGCGVGADCVSGFCVSNGLCAPCVADVDCGSGAVWCAWGVCKQKKPNGTVCSVDQQCLSDHCLQGLCSDQKKSNGTACGAGSECASGNYVDGVCCLQPDCGPSGDCWVCDASGFAGQCHNAEVGYHCSAGTCESTGSCVNKCIWNVTGSPVLDTTGIAVDSSGNASITGITADTGDFGCGPIAGLTSHDIFSARLNPSGACLFSKAAGNDTAWEYVLDVAVDGAGNTIIAAQCYGTLDFGCGPVTAAGADDACVVKFDSLGNCVWNRFAGTNAEATGVVTDDSGNVFVVGLFKQSLDFGCGIMWSMGYSPAAFIAELDPAGNCVWSKTAPGAGHLEIRSVARDGSGNLLIGGEIGEVDFGCGTITSAGGINPFVAKLDATGTCLWSVHAGDTKFQRLRSIAADTAGNALITGEFDGNLDFGCGTLAATTSSDLYVAKLGAAGNCIWSKNGGVSNAQPKNGAIVADSAGNAIVTGTYAGTIDLGCGSYPSAKGYSFLTKFDPLGNCLSSYYSLTAVFTTLALDASDDIWVLGSGAPTDLGCTAVGTGLSVAKFAP